MDIPAIKSFLKSGNYNRLPQRVEQLKMMGIEVELLHNGSKASRLQVNAEDGFPHVFHIYSMASIPAHIHFPDDGKPYGKDYRKGYR